MRKLIKSQPRYPSTDPSSTHTFAHFKPIIKVEKKRKRQMLKCLNLFLVAGKKIENLKLVKHAHALARIAHTN